MVLSRRHSAVHYEAHEDTLLLKDHFHTKRRRGGRGISSSAAKTSHGRGGVDRFTLASPPRRSKSLQVDSKTQWGSNTSKSKTNEVVRQRLLIVNQHPRDEEERDPESSQLMASLFIEDEEDMMLDEESSSSMKRSSSMSSSTMRRPDAPPANRFSRIARSFKSLVKSRSSSSSNNNHKDHDFRHGRQQCRQNKGLQVSENTILSFSEYEERFPGMVKAAELGILPTSIVMEQQQNTYDIDDDNPNGNPRRKVWMYHGAHSSTSSKCSSSSSNKDNDRKDKVAAAIRIDPASSSSSVSNHGNVMNTTTEQRDNHYWNVHSNPLHPARDQPLLDDCEVDSTSSDDEQHNEITKDKKDEQQQPASSSTTDADALSVSTEKILENLPIALKRTGSVLWWV